jgi:hypothetical protein
VFGSIVEGGEGGWCPFVDPVFEDPAGAVVAAFPVDDEVVEAGAGCVAEGSECWVVVAVLAEFPDVGDAVGDEVFAVEVAEFGEAAVLDGVFGEGFDVADVVECEFVLEQDALKVVRRVDEVGIYSSSVSSGAISSK